MIGESLLLLEGAVIKEETQKEALNRELIPFFDHLSKGNMESLGPIYDLCARYLYGLALWRTGSQSDAADVVQEVFARIANRTDLHRTIRNPYAYLLRMAHTISCDVLRKRKRDLFVKDLLLEPSNTKTDATDTSMELSHLLHELPPEQREALYLHYYSGLSLREISKVSGISLFTAASRCRLGIAKLRKRLKGIK